MLLLYLTEGRIGRREDNFDLLPYCKRKNRPFAVSPSRDLFYKIIGYKLNNLR